MPVPVRLRDWRECTRPRATTKSSVQALVMHGLRIPFCMQGCPLRKSNSDLQRSRVPLTTGQAAEQLFDTNNFPEFTVRLCPAPCESACVLGISDSPVTIERIEYEVAEHAFAYGFAVAHEVATRTGKRVAVVGSGPAGLAGRGQLASVGHHVHVFERSDAIGALALRHTEFQTGKRRYRSTASP